MKAGKIGVAVIGLRMGRAHLDGYKQNLHCRIVGVCDTDSSQLKEIQKAYDAPVAVRDYRQLLGNPDIQLISVASPDFFHAEQAIAALRAGKDVMCEKPMTPTVEEAKAVVAAVKETGRRFMVGQVCRYAPGFMLAKAMVERGEIGEMYLAESEYAHDYSIARGVGDWRVDARREPFLGGGCHAVDVMRWIAGDAEEAFAYANHKCLPGWPINDCTMAVYKLRNGVIGKVMVSIGCIRPYTMRSVFYGTEGTIICDNTSPEIQLCNRRNFTTHPVFAAFPVAIASHNVSTEIDEFVDCILSDKAVPTNEAEGAKTVVTALAAVKSAKEGRPVRIADLWAEAACGEEDTCRPSSAKKPVRRQALRADGHGR
jgi:UDP-N-acetylglucosamine 3-dehydrogenase